MSDTVIEIPTVKHNITTKPQSTSYGAWAKAGLVFGVTTGAFLLVKTTGVLSWVIGLFGSSNASKSTAIVTVQTKPTADAGWRDSLFTLSDAMKASNSKGAEVVEFKARSDDPLLVNTTQVFRGPVTQAEISLQGGKLLPTWFSATVLPLVQGSYITPIDVNGLTISDNIAYMLAGVSGWNQLQIVNISDSKLIARLDMDGYAKGLAFSKNMLCVAALNKLHLIGVSNPAVPVPEGEFTTLGDIECVTVSGNTAYVVASNALAIINTSNHTLIGTCPIPPNEQWLSRQWIITSENMVYVGASNVLSIIDISDLAHPVFIVNHTMTDVKGLAVSKKMAYVITSDLLSIIDMSVPAKPELKGTCFISGAQGVTISGSMAYVETAHTLQIVDVRDPTKPVLNGSYRTPIPGSIRKVAISENTAYVAEAFDDVSRMQMVDIGTMWQLKQTVEFMNPVTLNLEVTARNSTGSIVSQAMTLNAKYSLMLGNNTLTVDAGQTVTVTNAYLGATDVNNDQASFTFTVSAVEHGSFVLNNVATTTFTQQDIRNGAISFVADQSGTAPSYMVSVSDGIVSTIPTSAIVYFTAPNNKLSNALIGGLVGGGAVGLLALIGTGLVARGVIKKYREQQAEHANEREALLSGTAQLHEELTQLTTHNMKSDDPTVQAFFQHLNISPNSLISSDRLIYEENAIIGTGTFAVVYKATMDRSTEVVVKVLNSTKCLGTTSWEALDQIGQRDVKDFCREVNIMAKLSHYNIVQFFGASIQSGRFAIVMEYVAGGSLRNFLEKDKQNGGLLSLPSRFEMIHGVAAGLHYVHHEGVIHRDIKSSNCLVEIIHTDSGLSYVVKIADLGLSKDIKQLTMSNNTASAIGSPIWMAPELLVTTGETGGDAGFFSDIYAYSIVIWEVLTENEPYANIGSNVWQLCRHVIEGGRPIIPEAMSNVWKALLACCWGHEMRSRPNIDSIIEYCNRYKNELCREFSSSSSTSLTLEQYKQELLNIPVVEVTVAAAAASTSSAAELLFSRRQKVSTSTHGTPSAMAAAPLSLPRAQSMHR